MSIASQWLFTAGAGTYFLPGAKGLARGFRGRVGSMAGGGSPIHAPGPDVSTSDPRGAVPRLDMELGDVSEDRHSQSRTSKDREPSDVSKARLSQSSSFAAEDDQSELPLFIDEELVEARDSSE